ncbi:SWIM zinc finger family protein [Streptomyces coeruleorubidus]|uniref:SWIM zinc finger family protein n=1 Tax=Streptomyces coeruleorubidus TaxID=116188 RepID=A0ABZ0KAN8_STRC4|nr:SWIM zinc finger family protein [Streptomyces coeruleorubidus]WOT34789.1 SWIM zinc finger family protein [Streptomyces coeruleorubidus]
MTQQGVRWTADQVLALAPDAASRKAGSKLGAAGPWSEAGSSDEGTVWGLCKGSGSKPYQTVVDIADASGPAYKCSCPSRKFPCKHALGLLLLWAGGDAAVPTGEAPEWAGQWIAGRRKRTEEKRAADSSGAPSGSADPEAARRRAERRAERVTAGAVELEQRLADLLRAGLATAEQSGYGLWEETAARMVDAQAQGLAGRVRELGAIPSTGPGWPVRLLEECALLHLLGQGWLRRERLPEALAATVRSRIGLPASADGPPVRDRWLVLAQYDTADTRLTTRRIWLYGADSDRTVLLLSYGAAGRAPELALPVGLALEAEVSAYPGAGRLRVALGEQFAPPAPTAIRPQGMTTSQAAARYGDALRDDPWLDSVPVTLGRVVPTPDGDSWQLADADEDAALPLTPSARSRPGLWRLVALSGGAPVRVFGECGHQGFTPLTAWPEGPGDAIALC